MQKCKGEIKKTFVEKFDYDNSYSNFIKSQKIDDLYEFLTRWNSNIRNFKGKNKQKVKEALKEIVNLDVKDLGEKEYLKKIVEILTEFGKNFKIPALKLAHILNPDIFPLLDNNIIAFLKNTKNSGNLKVDKFMDFVFKYKECLNENLPKEIDYKTFDEFLFLNVSQKIEINKIFNSNDCKEKFIKLREKIKNCMLQKLKKRKKLKPIGIMCAMVEELEPILERVELKEKIFHGNNTYYLAEFEGRELVLAYSKIGKVNATMTAASMIEKFGIKKLLFSGVAGAVDSDLKIGDLIVASEVCQHDIDLSVFGYKYGFIPESQIFFDCDNRLIYLAERVAKRMNIKLKKGIIASGDQFIHSKEKKRWIKEVFGASAIEMEGGAVGCVAWNYQVPFFMLRAISDTAEEGAGVDFDEFLEFSSKRSADFLIEMLKDIDE